jgi:transcriptional regulator with XRE-family HTH domain
MMSRLSEKIKLLREELQMSSTDLAEKLNVEKSTIRLWEMGQKKPDKKSLLKMSEVFQCSIDDLLDDEGASRLNLLKRSEQHMLQPFYNELNSRYSLFKLIYVIIIFILAIILRNGSIVISFIFLIFTSGIILYDIWSLYDVNSKFNKRKQPAIEEHSFIHMHDAKEIKNEYHYKMVRLIFSFFASLVAFPIIYEMIGTSDSDLWFKILSAIIYLMLMLLYLMVLVTDILFKLNKSEITYTQFLPNIRLNLRKALILFHEIIFLMTYTILLYFGSNGLSFSDAWIFIFFPAAFIIFTQMIYIDEIKTIGYYKIK